MLQIEDLRTYYGTEAGDVQAADGVSFELEEGETLGLVGESGSGKTTIARSIIRLLPDNADVVGGSIRYEGTDLTTLSMKELRQQIRWKEISMVPQNAMNGFDPVYTVGEQIVEVIQYHEPDTSREEAESRARVLFEKLGLEEERVSDYPHQFSGGMIQRAMIALSLALDPKLVLADEPTTALDVVMQDRILDTITELQEEIGSAMILITHDISVVSEVCDRIAVVYGGQIVEIGDTVEIITNPRHPYTLGLRNAFPDIAEDDQELISIPGTPPDLTDPDEGCRFAPRCPFAVEECWNETPEPEVVGEGHRVECHRAEEVDYLQEQSAEKETWRAAARENESVTAEGTPDE